MRNELSDSKQTGTEPLGPQRGISMLLADTRDAKVFEFSHCSSVRGGVRLCFVRLQRLAKFQSSGQLPCEVRTLEVRVKVFDFIFLV